MNNIIVLLILLYCSGYYYSITSFGSVMTLFVLLLAAVFLMRRVYVKKNGITLSKNRLFFCVFFVFIVIISGILNLNIGLGAIKLVLTTVCAFLLVENMEWEEFRSLFVKGMACVCVAALIGYLLMFTPGINSLPQIQNYNNETYVSGLFFSSLVYQYAGVSNRMQGVFWEPGIFATYLIIAILFCEKNKSNKLRYNLYMVLFVVCLFMTRSGAGLLLLPVVLIVKYVMNTHEKNESLYKTVLIAVALGVFILFDLTFNVMANNEFLNRYLFSKLGDVENITMASRLGAAIIDMNIGINNPLFGVGVDGYVPSISLYRGEWISAGTSTLTTYFAYFGVFGVIIGLFWLRGIYRMSDKLHWIARIGISFIMLVILSKEPHISLLFMNCLLFYSLNEKHMFSKAYWIREEHTVEDFSKR